MNSTTTLKTDQLRSLLDRMDRANRDFPVETRVRTEFDRGGRGPLVGTVVQAERKSILNGNQNIVSDDGGAFATVGTFSDVFVAIRWENSTLGGDMIGSQEPENLEVVLPAPTFSVETDHFVSRESTGSDSVRFIVPVKHEAETALEAAQKRMNELGNYDRNNTVLLRVTDEDGNRSHFAGRIELGRCIVSSIEDASGDR